MKILFLTLLASVVCLASSEVAGAVEYQSPRTLGLGGAGRAAPLLNDAIYLNPSHASFTPIYSLYAGYVKFESGRNYNVSVLDSRTELFQAGLGYTVRERDAVVNVGASKQVIERLGVGLGSKMLLGRNGERPLSELNFSTSFIALPWMYTSLIIDNLIEDRARISKGLYRTAYLAFKFIPTKKVEFFVDPLYSPSYELGRKAGYSAGMELGMLEDFYFRIGKFQDGEIAHLGTRGSGYGFGLGWIAPKLNIEYAMSRAQTTHTAGGDVAHSGALTVFY
jgi:hypothetical protein